MLNLIFFKEIKKKKKKKKKKNTVSSAAILLGSLRVNKPAYQDPCLPSIFLQSQNDTSWTKHMNCRYSIPEDCMTSNNVVEDNTCNADSQLCRRGN